MVAPVRQCAVTTQQTLPEEVGALRVLVLAAWAERDAERADRVSLADERDRLAGQNDRLRDLIRQLQRLPIPTLSSAASDRLR